MPLILLLNRQLGLVTGGASKIASLSDTMDRAADVLRRRRAAFLTAWFGPGLPVDGLQLRVTIVNHPAVAGRIDRSRQLQADYAAGRAGPNLVEPIAGMAGTITGSLLGAFATAGAIVAVLFVVCPPLGVVGVVPAVALLVRWIGTLWRARALWNGYKELSGAPGARSSGMPAWFEMGADGAAALAAGTDLGELLLNGADAATDRHPVAAALRHLADRVAALATRALGAVALFLSLAPVAEIVRDGLGRVRWAAGFFERVAEAALSSLTEAVTHADHRGGLRALLTGLIRWLPAVARDLGRRMLFGIDRVALPFRRLGADGRALRDRMVTLLKPVTTGHPVVAFLLALGPLGTAVKGVGRSLREIGRRIGANLMPDSVAALLAAGRALQRLVSSATPASSPPSRPPAPPAAPTALDRAGELVDLARLGGVTGVAAPVLSNLLAEELAARPVQIVGSVPTVFAAERAREVARQATLDQASFHLAATIVASVAHLAGYDIDAEMARLERSVAVDGRRPPHPVRDLPTPRHLLPVIGRLRVVAPGRDRAATRQWTDDVVAAVGRTPIPAPTDTAEPATGRPGTARPPAPTGRR